uniref:Uncharacterized protein n=1 Tax=Panagrolaimus sp. JU765 TaxID=591449 RepID=A0AC34RR87_9BILA
MYNGGYGGMYNNAYDYSPYLYGAYGSYGMNGGMNSMGGGMNSMAGGMNSMGGGMGMGGLGGMMNSYLMNPYMDGISGVGMMGNLGSLGGYGMPYGNYGGYGLASAGSSNLYNNAYSNYGSAGTPYGRSSTFAKPYAKAVPDPINNSRYQQSPSVANQSSASTGCGSPRCANNAWDNILPSV